MDLESFVKNTLEQVIKGVAGARAIVGDDRFPQKRGPGTNFLIGDQKYSEVVPQDPYLQMIEFDVAITATETSEIGAQGGVKVLGMIEAGGKGTSGTLDSTVSRVKFSVPAIL